MKDRSHDRAGRRFVHRGTAAGSAQQRRFSSKPMSVTSTSEHEEESEVCVVEERACVRSDVACHQEVEGLQHVVTVREHWNHTTHLLLFKDSYAAQTLLFENMCEVRPQAFLD